MRPNTTLYNTLDDIFKIRKIVAGMKRNGVENVDGVTAVLNAKRRYRPTDIISTG